MSTENNKLKIGFIGAGLIGGGLARLAVQSGHQVFISNSRGPKTLFSLLGGLGANAQAGTPEQAAEFGDIVVISIPMSAYQSIPVAALKGKIIIDTINYFPQRDGNIAEIDNGTTTSAELLAGLLPESKLVKAFNTILSTELATTHSAPGTANRRALPLAGNDAEAKAVVAGLIDQLGFDTVDVGTLADGKLMEFGGQLFNIQFDKSELEAILKK